VSSPGQTVDEGSQGWSACYRDCSFESGQVIPDSDLCCPPALPFWKLKVFRDLGKT